MVSPNHPCLNYWWVVQNKYYEWLYAYSALHYMMLWNFFLGVWNHYNSRLWPCLWSLTQRYCLFSKLWNLSQIISSFQLTSFFLSIVSLIVHILVEYNPAVWPSSTTNKWENFYLFLYPKMYRLTTQAHIG